MIFKIKTTNPGKFIVKPNVGQLSPESSTTISIMFFGNTVTVRQSVINYSIGCSRNQGCKVLGSLRTN